MARSINRSSGCVSCFPVFKHLPRSFFRYDFVLEKLVRQSHDEPLKIVVSDEIGGDGLEESELCLGEITARENPRVPFRVLVITSDRLSLDVVATFE